MNLKVQNRVGQWVLRAFGGSIATNLWERGMRVVEEAVELGQVVGVREEEVHRLVARVFSRPVGTIRGELGGVGVTMLAFAEAANESAIHCIESEISRVDTPEMIARCRAKQREKVEAGVGLGVDVAAKVRGLKPDTYPSDLS